MKISKRNQAMRDPLQITISKRKRRGDTSFLFKKGPAVFQFSPSIQRFPHSGRIEQRTSSPSPTRILAHALETSVHSHSTTKPRNQLPVNHKHHQESVVTLYLLPSLMTSPHSSCPPWRQTLVNHGNEWAPPTPLAVHSPVSFSFPKPQRQFRLDARAPKRNKLVNPQLPHSESKYRPLTPKTVWLFHFSPFHRHTWWTFTDVIRS